MTILGYNDYNEFHIFCKRTRLTRPETFAAKSYQKVGSKIRVLREDYFTNMYFYYSDKYNKIIGLHHSFSDYENNYLIKKMNKDYLYMYNYICSAKGITRDQLQKYYQSPKIYLTHIYNLKNKRYLDDTQFEAKAKRMGLDIVPILYEGPFISEEHINTIRKNEEEKSTILFRSVVVETKANWTKNCPPLNISYITEEYKNSSISPTHLRKSKFTNRINIALTYTRVEAVLNSLIAEQKLPNNLSTENMKEILEIVDDSVFELILNDMSKQSEYYFEEHELEQTRKIIRKRTPRLIKRIIWNRKIAKI